LRFKIFAFPGTQKRASRILTCALLLAGEEGLEPPTARFGDVCSAKLSYSPSTTPF
jgi:hypothetical protein